MKIIAAVFKYVRATISLRDILLAVGLGLSAYGLSLVWLPSSYLFPGLVLTYVAIFGVK